MDKIDLDAICTEEAKKFSTGSLKEADGMALYLRNVMKEAIHQALVLADQKYVNYIGLLAGQSFEGWSEGAKQGYITALVSLQNASLILDVEKLIV